MLCGPRSCSKERLHRGAALWVLPSRSGPVQHWRAAVYDRHVSRVARVRPALDWRRDKSTKWVFRKEAVAASPPERAKLSTLPTSSSCDKDGWHNVHNCILASAIGIVIDIIVAPATLRSTAWGIVRDLERQDGNVFVAWPLPDGDPLRRPAHVTVQTAATNEATTFLLQLRFCAPQPGRPRAEALSDT